MVATFNYFLDTKDCDIGYAADDCRLVQRWVWYSLDDYVEPAPHVPGRFNPFQSLLIPDTEELSTAGKAFREYTLIRERLSELMKQPY
jgi:hypothetical protein